jgi:hypothetical protein
MWRTLIRSQHAQRTELKFINKKGIGRGMKWMKEIRGYEECWEEVYESTLQRISAWETWPGRSTRRVLIVAGANAKL